MRSPPDVRPGMTPSRRLLLLGAIPLLGGAAERVPVLPDDDADSLKERVQAVEHRLLPQVVRELISR